jgi:signal transduction histidine kinase
VTTNEQVIGVIRAAQPTGASDARIRDYLAGLLALAVVVFGVVALSASILARRLARPVRALSRATVDLGSGDFAPRVPATGIEEIDDAATALRRTAARLEDLLGRERAFSTDASHQLRTPLAGMRTAIETELVFPRDDRELVLGELLEDVDRLEQTVTALLQAARAYGASSATADLNQILDQTVRAWRGRLAPQGRPLRLLRHPELPPVRGDATLLTTALDVLLDNALTHGAGEVAIESEVSAQTITVAVVDEGPGMPSSRPTPGDLHGHGLALASRLVSSFGGRLVVPRSGHEARMEIVLQRADAS